MNRSGMRLAFDLRGMKFLGKLAESLFLLCNLRTFRLMLLAFAKIPKNSTATSANESNSLYRHVFFISDLVIICMQEGFLRITRARTKE